MERVVLVALLGCGDGAKPAIDAAIDAAIAATDAAAYSPYGDCRVPTDCPSTSPGCCIMCSPGGACSRSSCVAADVTSCAYSLCEAGQSCTKRNGDPGTCQQAQITFPNTPATIWACQ
jgi:hypothetical protein